MIDLSIWVTARSFNPGLGFQSVATTFQTPDVSHQRVSIPVWVFSPSRRWTDIPVDVGGEFQSRSGFSVRRDTAEDPTVRGEISFNPGLGFQSVATRFTSSASITTG